jgi:hypothetical protein
MGTPRIHASGFSRAANKEIDAMGMKDKNPVHDGSPVIYGLDRREEMIVQIFGCNWDRTAQEQEDHPNPCYLGSQPGEG